MFKKHMKAIQSLQFRVDDLKNSFGRMKKFCEQDSFFEEKNNEILDLNDALITLKNSIDYRLNYVEKFEIKELISGLTEDFEKIENLIKGPR